MNMKKKIWILATGGTIAGLSHSATDTTGYEAALLPVEALVSEAGPVANIAEIHCEQLAQVDSADMNHELWLAIARRINALLARDDVDGVVVTHGTDTLEETAYFLNLTVGSAKPVVLVGAMRPANVISSDGPMNLYNAVVLATSPEARGKGVLVALNDTINCSRDVTKTNTALQDTFKAPELGYLGYLVDGRAHFYRAPTRKHTFMSEFAAAEVEALPRVEILFGHVNDGGEMAVAAAAAGARGLVYAGLGNGNMSRVMEAALREVRRRGIVVVRSTRVPNGVVNRNGAVDDDGCDFVAADTLSPQKARILLMLALTRTDRPADIQRLFWEY